MDIGYALPVLRIKTINLYTGDCFSTLDSAGNEVFA